MVFEAGQGLAPPIHVDTPHATHTTLGSRSWPVTYARGTNSSQCLCDNWGHTKPQTQSVWGMPQTSCCLLFAHISNPQLPCSCIVWPRLGH